MTTEEIVEAITKETAEETAEETIPAPAEEPRRFKKEWHYYIALDQGATCCDDKHQTFYGAVVRSPYWAKWCSESYTRFSDWCVASEACLESEKTTFHKKPHPPFFDVDECTECGMISSEHFQAFLEFVASEMQKEKQ